MQPVIGGGIPPSNIAVQLKMTFKDGGAFDFHSAFERIKDRLQQVVEQARESGLTRRSEAQGGVDFSNVHLEELPAYEGPISTLSTNPPPFSERTRPDDGAHITESQRRSSRGNAVELPTEPPPGYEETQQQGVANDFEDRLRQAL